MKKILLSAVLIGSLFANEENYVELGIGHIKSKDNFSTSSQSNISALNGAKEESDGFALLNFYYGYELDDDSSIYASAELGGLNLGYNFMTDVGEFDVGISGELGGEEWENPFTTNTNRKKTYVNEVGAYVSYGFEVSPAYQANILYSYSKRSYDKETVQDDLKRDGTRHILALDNVYTINNGDLSFLFNTSYEKYNAQGDASTYDTYLLELGLSANVSQNVNLTLMTEFGKKDYDKSNPVFGKKVDANIKGIVGIATWDKPFGYENFYSSFKVGHQEEDANVNFYDKENTFTMLSVGYVF